MHEQTSAHGDRLEAALRYIREDYPVLPVNRQKVPLVKAWPTAASTSESQVRRWWEQYPDAGIGIVTGERSGLLVVDVDPRNIEDPRAVAAVLDAMPRTRTHATGGGGRHYLFRHVAGVKNGSIIHGIDIKADGGFIVAPPSIHSSGKPYTVSDSSPVAALPAELVECLPRKAETSRLQNRERIEATPPPGRDINTRLEGALMERNGTRNGDEIKHSCLFHDDNHPSASYNTAKRAFQCFACGTRGGWYKLAVKLNLLQPQDSPQRQTIRQIATLAESVQWKGVKGATAREVLLAHCRIAHRANRRDGYTASARQVAELAGKNKETVINAQRQLRLAGWLHLHRCQCGDPFCQRLGTGRFHSRQASTWTLSLPNTATLHFPTTKVPTPVYGREEKILYGLCNTEHDAFRWRRGLGPHGRHVLQLLDQGPWKSATALARAVGAHRATVSRMLVKLEACDAAARTAEGWTRGPASLDAIAQHLGTAGAGARQRQEHQAEREMYQQRLIEAEELPRLVLVPEEELESTPLAHDRNRASAGGVGFELASDGLNASPVDKFSARAQTFRAR